jgi:hypothetical protein
VCGHEALPSFLQTVISLRLCSVTRISDSVQDSHHRNATAKRNRSDSGNQTILAFSRCAARRMASRRDSAFGGASGWSGNGFTLMSKDQDELAKATQENCARRYGSELCAHLTVFLLFCFFVLQGIQSLFTMIWSASTFFAKRIKFTKPSIRWNPVRD